MKSSPGVALMRPKRFRMVQKCIFICFRCFAMEMKRIAEFKRAPRPFEAAPLHLGFLYPFFLCCGAVFHPLFDLRARDFVHTRKKAFPCMIQTKIIWNKISESKNWLFALRRSTPFNSRNTPCSQRNRVKHHHGCNQRTLSLWNGHRKSARTIWRAEIDQNRQSLQTRFTFWGEFWPCAAEVKIRKLFFEIASWKLKFH